MCVAIAGVLLLRTGLHARLPSVLHSQKPEAIAPHHTVVCDGMTWITIVIKRYASDFGPFVQACMRFD